MKYVCEVCEAEAELTEEEAYQSGWDYPPFIGAWGIVSPRTCPNCPMTDTAWWAAVTQPKVGLSEKHMATVKRIMEETNEHPALADTGQQ